MTATTALFIVLGAWIVIGIVAAIAMGRRGHSPFTWVVLGAVLGPLVVPVGLAAARDEQPRGRPSMSLRIPVPAAGEPLDVLIGVDGSKDALGAMRRGIELLGPRIGRCTIATVLDYDVGLSNVPTAEQERGRAVLAEAVAVATPVLGREPESELLVGRPADALCRHLRDGGYHLVVIAPRGHGLSEYVFGSVASRLARVGVPVAILPPEDGVQEKSAPDTGEGGPGA